MRNYAYKANAYIMMDYLGLQTQVGAQADIMPPPDTRQTDSISEIGRLTSTGRLGFYTSVEATEIVAFSPEAKAPSNLFTLLVAEERRPGFAETPRFLNPKPIRISGLDDWSFGICRYIFPVDRLIPAFQALADTGSWGASGKALRYPQLTAQPAEFVPPGSLRQVAWNKVLKNNFWNGCYVVEWADVRKAALAPFFAAPHHLQALSQAIAEYVPIKIAALSDRLGNIALQLPATVLMARFNGRRDGGVVAQIGWHPNARPRPLRASVQMNHDDVIAGYRSIPIDSETTVLPLRPGQGTHQGVIWDDANGLILAAIGESAFIRTIGMNMQPISPEPRVFSYPDDDGAVQTHRVATNSTIKNVIGTQKGDEEQEWTRRRIYREETSRLARQRHFLQYRPAPGGKNEEHARALGDIRTLINQHGEDGAWLWDPYLSALDILKTLFFSPHQGSDLRGLTARKEPPEQGGRDYADYVQRQRDTFTDANSNLHGMCLEFRANFGPSGWEFHDRFLIFPRTDQEALVWSLGTSVNSVGKAHHILQQVADGQQVMDAFVELWDRLSGAENLVWKTPS